MEKKRKSIVYMILLPAISCLIAAGCGGGAGSVSYNNEQAADAVDSVAPSGSSAGLAAYEDAAEEDAPGEGQEEAVPSAGEEPAAGEGSAGKPAQILIYQGTVRIDTLDFDAAVRQFRALVEENGGFIESEGTYDDGGTTYYWYEDGRESQGVKRTFNGTARIPSENYYAFIGGMPSLGNVRSQDSSVTNMTQEYGTLSAQLEIYQAEYDRYLAMLDTVSEDEAIIRIQENLTELAVNIATVKSQMSVITTDADYSTVDVTLNEVLKYEKERDETTFVNRLKNAVRDGWEGFLGFLEAVLFFILRFWYYIAILAVLILIMSKISKARRSRGWNRPRQNQGGMQGRQQYSGQNQGGMQGRQQYSGQNRGGMQGRQQYSGQNQSGMQGQPYSGQNQGVGGQAAAPGANPAAAGKAPETDPHSKTAEGTNSCDEGEEDIHSNKEGQNES